MLNCYVHSDRESVGACVGCGKFFCQECCTEVNGKVYCKSCIQNKLNEQEEGGKDWLLALLLSIFLGGLGIHRFYVGKIGTGILQLITFGGCGIWALIDIILIATGKFTDSNGNLLQKR